MKNVLKFCLLIFIVSSCSINLDTDKKKTSESEHLDSPFIHTAYFWFKEEATKEQIEAFKKDSERLAEIKTVKFFHAGKPAPTNRPVIENSYDWAIIFHFKDLEDQDFYQKASLHLEMIEKHQAIWEKVMVTDISD